MGPRLARVYSLPGVYHRPAGVFSRRTLGVACGLLTSAVACWALGVDELGTALFAVFTVCAMQLVAPWIRQLSLARSGLVAEILFAAPFVLFFLPYLAWTVAEPPPFSWSTAGAAGALLVAATFQAVAWKEWTLGFQRELLELMAPLQLPVVLLRSYQMLVSAVTQELFYRGALFVLLLPSFGFWTVLITTGLFTLEHLGNRWATSVHKPVYYIRIAGFAFCLGALVYATDSVWPAIIGHVAFNLVPVVQLSFRYVVSRRPALESAVV